MCARQSTWFLACVEVFVVIVVMVMVAALGPNGEQLGVSKRG